MDIYTIISILLILFVGFYDLIVNRLKKYKFSDENIDNALQTIREQSTNNKLKQKQKRRLIVFALLYVPLALTSQIVLDLIFDAISSSGILLGEKFSGEYFKSLFGINQDEYDIPRLIINYCIFSIFYFIIGFFVVQEGINTRKILSSYITIKSLARLLFIIIMSFFSKPILHLLFNPLKVRKGRGPLETADLKYHYEHFFEEGTIFYLYSFALFFLINFIYNELVKKSSGNKKEDVILKLSYLKELYKNKLIDKEEYESKLKNLKKEASKSI
jgi:hypothetical protein